MATQDASLQTGGPAQPEITIPLHAEEVSVTKRQTALGTVRVQLHTEARDQAIDEMLSRERVDVQRVAIGRTVDAVPAIREEGDTTIIPVIEEVLVIERRLVLKEEIRLTRVRTHERHQETVTLREQHATVERTAPRRDHAQQSETLKERVS